jgi:lipopolysaccharide heptosyltransferase II
MLIKGNSLQTQDIRNILLIQLGDIGDVVLTFPCLRALREHFPQAAIIIAVMEKAKELIEDCPWVSGVITINKEKRSLFQEISYQGSFFSEVRKYHFDLAIDMRRGTRGAILGYLSGARQRIGFYSYKKGLFRNSLFSHLAVPVKKPGQHMTEYYLSLLEEYHLDTEKIRPELYISHEKQQRATALFREEEIPLGRPIVALQPFSLWQRKEWGIKKYGQLINWIRSAYGFPVIITGSARERGRAEEIVAVCGGNAFNLAGKTSLSILGAVIKRCGLLIGVDSAGIHIAAAVGTPTVSIFGPTLFSSWAPRGEQHRIVHKDLPCVPCDKKGCNGSGVSLCLEELTVEEVQHVVREHVHRVVKV